MITLDTPLLIVNLLFIKHNKSTPMGQCHAAWRGAPALAGIEICGLQPRAMLSGTVESIDRSELRTPCRTVPLDREGIFHTIAGAAFFLLLSFGPEFDRTGSTCRLVLLSSLNDLWFPLSSKNRCIHEGHQGFSGRAD